MGPKASLSHSCLESGRRFEVLAKIKLMDDNLNAVDCDPLAGINSHCPILTIHYTTLSGEEKWMYVGNINFSGWDMYNFNDFHGVFVVSEELALSTEAYFYFERPSPGTVIMLDNVEIKEVVSDADADYKFMSDSCVKVSYIVLDSAFIKVVFLSNSTIFLNFYVYDLKFVLNGNAEVSA